MTLEGSSAILACHLVLMAVIHSSEGECIREARIALSCSVKLKEEALTEKRELSRRC